MVKSILVGKKSKDRKQKSHVNKSETHIKYQTEILTAETTCYPEFNSVPSQNLKLPWQKSK